MSSSQSAEQNPEQGAEKPANELLVPLWLEDRFRNDGWEILLPYQRVPLNGQDWIRMWWAGKGEPKLPER